MTSNVDLSKLSQEEIERIQKAIAPVLTAVAARIDSAETRRASYGTIATAYLAGGLSLATIGVGIQGELFRIGLLAAAASLLAFAILISYLHATQINRSGFASSQLVWKWFYKGALTINGASELPRVPAFPTGADLKDIRDTYSSKLPEFAQLIAKLKHPEANLDQDIQQLYMLLIIERHTNAHLTVLRFLTAICTIATPVVGLAAVAIVRGSV